jgi:hypothetical protein
VPARDLARPHARERGLVERGAHGGAGGLARRRRAAQVLARPGQQRAGGLDRRVEPAGDLLVREPVDRAHHQDGALPVRQAVDVAEQRPRLGAAGELVRQLRGERGHAVQLDVAHGAGTAAAQLVHARVVDEPQQPRARLERHDAASQRGVDAQEDVLEDVL